MEQIFVPYIKRNDNREIIGIFCEQQEDAQEELGVNSKEVIDFLGSNDYIEYTNYMLNQSDSEFIRVLEDLIDVLLDKHILLLTDLPEAAQQKLLKRKKIRKEHITSIIADDDNIF